MGRAARLVQGGTALAALGRPGAKSPRGKSARLHGIFERSLERDPPEMTRPGTRRRKRRPRRWNPPLRWTATGLPEFRSHARRGNRAGRASTRRAGSVARASRVARQDRRRRSKLRPHPRWEKSPRRPRSRSKMTSAPISRMKEADAGSKPNGVGRDFSMTWRIMSRVVSQTSE